MSNFKIAVTQVPSVKGNVPANIEIHLNAIKKAANSGVSYIVFPELSLTGYETEIAVELAFSNNDPRLTPLIEAAICYKIYIVAGAPLSTISLPHIGEFIIFPDGQVETYSKMYLHPGEEKYFSVGDNYHSVNLGDHKVFNAICADTNNIKHAQACAEQGATIYIAGVLISDGGYAADTRKLESYANRFGMLVAMANHNKPTGGWTPIGKSAIWGPSCLIATADQTQNALVIAGASPSGWNGAVVEI